MKEGRERARRGLERRNSAIAEIQFREAQVGAKREGETFICCVIQMTDED